MRTISERTNPFIGAPPTGSEPRHLFAVISWGCAATTWAAKALNSHPEILALHHGNLNLRPAYSDKRLDGVEYMWMLAYQGTGYTVAGDVHGVSRFSLPAIRETFGRGFSSAVLVREPAARLASLRAHFARFEGVEIFDLSYLDALIESKELSLPDMRYKTKLFVHGVNLLNAILEERLAGPIYKSEELTSDAKTFTSFVEQVTRGQVAIEPNWVQSVLRTVRVNPHVSDHVPLAPWQREVVGRVVDLEAWEMYADLGYAHPLSLIS